MKIIDTTLRDAHQSLIATRLTTHDILSVVEDLDKVGFYALEVWGGATFDVCHTFLNENPWERLRQIKKMATKTKLQMLLRGQNLVGYRPYANDTVKKFIQKSVENGIDIIRVFDALNDVNNLKTSIQAIIDTGAHCQVALAYTISPHHDLPYYVNLAKEVTALGAHSICIKDMSGILLPHVAEKLIKALKKVVDIPINLHGHDTSGVMAATYLRAIDVGVDMLDTAMSPFSSGNSQPPTESILNMLYPDDLHLHYQVDALASAKSKLTQIRQTFIDDGTLTFDALTPYPEILKTQVPGGMLSNLYSQLKHQHMEHKFMEVLAEVPKVRADLGYPPLVTPISQFIGVQASLNVMTNKRYHMVPNEIKQYLSGYYGKICGPLNQKVMKKIGITNHTYEPQFEFEEYKAERKKYDENSYSDENILSSIIIGPAYVLKQDVINDKIGEKKQYNFDIRFIEDAEFTLLAPYDCKIMHVHVALHQAVEENDIILTLLTTDQVHLEVLAPCKGVITQMYCHEDSSLLSNQPLFKLMR